MKQDFAKIQDFEKALLLLFAMDPQEILSQERQITILANLAFDRDKERAKAAFVEAESRGYSSSNNGNFYRLP